MNAIDELLKEGDVITLDNVPEVLGQQWRVCERRADGAVRLRPIGDEFAAFNDAAGDYWIVPGEFK